MEQNGGVIHRQASVIIKRRYVYLDRDRFGNVRVYLWRKGKRKLTDASPCRQRRI
jgi:hypothetical protein